MLIEHYAGRFPLWLAPRQVVVATIVSDANAYAEEAVAALRGAGLRAEVDLRNEKINYKVREHSLAKVPVILAVGHREVEERTVSLRRLGEKDSRVRRRSTPPSPSWPPRRRRPTCAEAWRTARRRLAAPRLFARDRAYPLKDVTKMLQREPHLRTLRTPARRATARRWRRLATARRSLP